MNPNPPPLNVVPGAIHKNIAFTIDKKTFDYHADQVAT
jgi:hypothetical protein